jgi:hypothetical protein
MDFLPYTPIAIPRQSNGLVIAKPPDLKAFWASVDETLEAGLSEAVGCYIFSIKAGKGQRPWYVGMAARQPFRKECFTAHKLRHYADALTTKKGTPYLTFLAKCTPGNSFAKPSKNRQRDIEQLETMLIANALTRNADLLNVRDTKLLREMVVPGLLNTSRGKPNASVKSFKSLLGLR